MDRVPGWYGVFVQKNGLGRMMAFAVLLFLIASRAQLSGPLVLRGGLILCAVLLALSKSVTALAVTALAIPFLIAAPVLRKSLWRLIFGLLVLGSAGTAVVFWVMANLDTVTDVIGRDVTMTGRLQLWAVSFVMALRHPWVGYGYSAFWLGLDGPSRTIWKIFAWHPPHPHNGLLSVWLDLGLIGVALLAVACAIYLVRAAQSYRRTDSPEAVWPLAYLVFFLLANLAESSVMTANGIFWMVFVAVAIGVSRTTPKVSLLRARLVPDAQRERDS